MIQNSCARPGNSNLYRKLRFLPKRGERYVQARLESRGGREILNINTAMTSQAEKLRKIIRERTKKVGFTGLSFVREREKSNYTEESLVHKQADAVKTNHEKLGR